MPAKTRQFLKKLSESLKNWLNQPVEPRPYKLDLSILEDRILYSATAMPITDAAPMDASGTSGHWFRIAAFTKP